MGGVIASAKFAFWREIFRMLANGAQTNRVAREVGGMALGNRISKADGSPQLRKSGEKRQTILRVAREIFLKHGYADTTTDMIQGASRVSKSTLYAHFASKEVLFSAICDMKSEEFASMLLDAVGEERRPYEYLQRFGLAFLRYLLSAEALAFYRLMVEASIRFPELGRAFYSAGIKKSCDLIEAYLLEVNRLGLLQIAHPTASAEHFLGMLRGEVYTRAVLNVGRSLGPKKQREHVARTVTDFLAMHGSKGSLY
jgi:AcrR family transcriptional regulator